MNNYVIKKYECMSSKYRIINSILLLLLSLLLHQNYIKRIYPIFSDIGYKISTGEDFFKFFFSYGTLILTIILVSKVSSNFLYAVLSIMISNWLIPNMIIFIEMLDNLDIFLFNFVLIIFPILVNKIEFSFPSLLYFKVEQLGLKGLNYLIIISSLIFAIMVYFLGIKINIQAILLDDDAIYSLRDNDIATQPGLQLIAYFQGWLARSFIPVGLVLSVMYSRKAAIVFFILLQILVFFFEGHKSILISTFVILFFTIGTQYQKKIFYYLLILNIGLIISQTIFKKMDYTIFDDLITRRLFFTPALLNVFYFDFFDNNKLYLSESVFKLFYKYPYNISSAYVIGEVYLGSNRIGANNGIISTGYMNFGYIGVMLNIISFNFIIRILDHLNLTSKSFGIVFLIINFLFISSSFFSCLNTHGVIITLFLLIFFLKNTRLNDF